MDTALYRALVAFFEAASRQTVFILGASLSLLLLSAPIQPAHASPDPIAEMRQEIGEERKRLEALSTETVSTLDTVESQVLESLEERRRNLATEVKAWREDLQYETSAYISTTFVDVEQLNRAIAEAEQVAQAYGLDVERLHDLYERTKGIIRHAEFVIPGKPHYDKDEKLTIRFKLLFVFAFDYEESLARARAEHQTFRLGMYKKASLAYLDALLAARQPPGQCDPVTAQSHETVTVDGVQAPLYGCPDPVVQKLRAYLDAVRTIASADADALAAEAELVVAEQQLFTDVISLVPLVGDAVDFYVIASGEDLAGTEFPPWMRKVMGLLVLIPAVNSRTAHTMIDQAMARSRSAAVAFESLNEYFRFVHYAASDSWYAFKWGAKDASQVAYRGAAKQLQIGVDQLKGLMERLPRLLDNRPRIDYGDKGFQMRAWRKIRDAIQSRFDIADFRRMVPAEIQERVLRRAERNVREGILDLQGTVGHAIKRSGIHSDHIDAFRRAAREGDELIIVRPVNPRSAQLMEELGAATKHMGIKSKSASEGPIAALIPVNQSLNKQGSELRELLARKRSAGSAGELADLEARIATLKKDLRKGATEMDKCLSKPDDCARAVVHRVDHPSGAGKVDLLVVKDKNTGQMVYGVEGPGGRLLDPESGRALDIAPVGKPQKVEVLATPDGRPITADYDILSFAKRDADYERLGSSPTMGGITEAEAKTVNRINELIDHPGGNVVHHGAEANYFGSRGADYPVTIFEPDGSVIHIPACDARCMADWCRRNPNRCKDGAAALDPDRLLKDYFYHKKLQGFNLDPNPNWKWGPFNVFAGFAARIHHAIF